jgi:hypothetical protein
MMMSATLTPFDTPDESSPTDAQPLSFRRLSRDVVIAFRRIFDARRRRHETLRLTPRR